MPVLRANPVLGEHSFTVCLQKPGGLEALAEKYPQAEGTHLKSP